jgi:hypothetical protein
MRPPGVENTSRLRSGPGGQQGQVRAAWWHEQQDEVVDGFLVVPQNQGRAGTTWELSHEVVIGGGYTELAGFPVVHQKTTGFLG